MSPDITICFISSRAFSVCPCVASAVKYAVHAKRVHCAGFLRITSQIDSTSSKRSWADNTRIAFTAAGRSSTCNVSFTLWSSGSTFISFSVKYTSSDMGSFSMSYSWCDKASILTISLSDTFTFMLPTSVDVNLAISLLVIAGSGE